MRRRADNRIRSDRDFTQQNRTIRVRCKESGRRKDPVSPPSRGRIQQLNRLEALAIEREAFLRHADHQNAFAAPSTHRDQDFSERYSPTSYVPFRENRRSRSYSHLPIAYERNPSPKRREPTRTDSMTTVNSDMILSSRINDHFTSPRRQDSKYLNEEPIIKLARGTLTGQGRITSRTSRYAENRDPSYAITQWPRGYPGMVEHGLASMQYRDLSGHGRLDVEYGEEQRLHSPESVISFGSYQQAPRRVRFEEEEGAHEHRYQSDYHHPNTRVLRDTRTVQEERQYQTGHDQPEPRVLRMRTLQDERQYQSGYHQPDTRVSRDTRTSQEERKYRTGYEQPDPREVRDMRTFQDERRHQSGYDQPEISNSQHPRYEAERNPNTQKRPYERSKSVVTYPQPGYVLRGFKSAPKTLDRPSKDTSPIKTAKVSHDHKSSKANGCVEKQQRTLNADRKPARPAEQSLSTKSSKVMSTTSIAKEQSQPKSKAQTQSQRQPTRPDQQSSSNESSSVKTIPAMSIEARMARNMRAFDETVARRQEDAARAMSRELEIRDGKPDHLIWLTSQDQPALSRSIQDHGARAAPPVGTSSLPHVEKTQPILFNSVDANGEKGLSPSLRNVAGLEAPSLKDTLPNSQSDRNESDQNQSSSGEYNKPASPKGCGFQTRRFKYNDDRITKFLSVSECSYVVELFNEEQANAQLMKSLQQDEDERGQLETLQESAEEAHHGQEETPSGTEHENAAEARHDRKEATSDGSLEKANHDQEQTQITPKHDIDGKEYHDREEASSDERHSKIPVLELDKFMETDQCDISVRDSVASMKTEQHDETSGVQHKKKPRSSLRSASPVAKSLLKSSMSMPAVSVPSRTLRRGKHASRVLLRPFNALNQLVTRSRSHLRESFLAEEQPDPSPQPSMAELLFKESVNVHLLDDNLQHIALANRRLAGHTSPPIPYSLRLERRMQNDFSPVKIPQLDNLLQNNSSLERKINTPEDEIIETAAEEDIRREIVDELHVPKQRHANQSNSARARTKIEDLPNKSLDSEDEGYKQRLFVYSQSPRFPGEKIDPYLEEDSKSEFVPPTPEAIRSSPLVPGPNHDNLQMPIGCSNTGRVLRPRKASEPSWTATPHVYLVPTERTGARGKDVQERLAAKNDYLNGADKPDSGMSQPDSQYRTRRGTLRGVLSGGMRGFSRKSITENNTTRSVPRSFSFADLRRQNTCETLDNGGMPVIPEPTDPPAVKKETKKVLQQSFSMTALRRQGTYENLRNLVFLKKPKPQAAREDSTSGLAESPSMADLDRQKTWETYDTAELHTPSPMISQETVLRELEIARDRLAEHIADTPPVFPVINMIPPTVPRQASGILGGGNEQFSSTNPKNLSATSSGRSGELVIGYLPNDIGMEGGNSSVQQSFVNSRGSEWSISDGDPFVKDTGDSSTIKTMYRRNFAGEAWLDGEQEEESEKKRRCAERARRVFEDDVVEEDLFGADNDQHADLTMPSTLSSFKPDARIRRSAGEIVRLIVFGNMLTSLMLQRTIRKASKLR